MIERIDDMPAGVVGLRGTGKLTREDYRDTLEPAIKEAIDSGELRLVFVLSDFDGLAAGAMSEDMKTGLSAIFGHHSAWKRFAMVTDTEWVARAMHLLAWMVPGDVMVCGPDRLEEAKRWAAG